jgi:hypothetical protein
MRDARIRSKSLRPVRERKERIRHATIAPPRTHAGFLDRHPARRRPDPPARPPTPNSADPVALEHPADDTALLSTRAAIVSSMTAALICSGFWAQDRRRGSSRRSRPVPSPPTARASRPGSHARSGRARSALNPAPGRAAHARSSTALSASRARRARRTPGAMTTSTNRRVARTSACAASADPPGPTTAHDAAERRERIARERRVRSPRRASIATAAPHGFACFTTHAADRSPAAPAVHERPHQVLAAASASSRLL